MEENCGMLNSLKDILSIEAFQTKDEEVVELYSRAYALP